MTRIGDRQPEMGVAGGHMGFLQALHAAGRPLTPTELGERLKLMPATVTGALTALEDQGLLSRARSEDDRRAVLVEMTPRGRDVAKRWGDVVVATLREAFAPLSEQELLEVASILGRVAPPIHGPPPGLPGLRHESGRRPRAKGAPAKRSARKGKERRP